jgi:hypothetical protein
MTGFVNDYCTCCLGNFGRVVCGAIVDHDNFMDQTRGHFVQQTPERFGLVQSRDDE